MSIPLDARWPLQFQAAMTRELREEGERLVLGEIGPSPALSEENSLPKLIHFGLFPISSFGLFPISAFGLFPISAFGPHSDDCSRCRLREVKFFESSDFKPGFLNNRSIAHGNTEITMPYMLIALCAARVSLVVNN